MIEIDRSLINKEFQQEKYAEFRKWYFSKYNKIELEKFKNEFYSWIDKSKKIIPFTQWFYGKYFYEIDQSINVIENYHRNWTTMDGKSIKAVHPPTVPIKIESGTSSEKQVVEAVAFFKPVDGAPNNLATENGLNRIHRQNNHTNMNLATICDQLGRIEDQVNEIRNENIPKNEGISSNDLHKAIIKPQIEVKGFKLSNPKKNLELLEELDKRLKGLSLNVITEGPDSDIDNQQLEEMETSFLQSQNDSINKVGYSGPRPWNMRDRYYYPRPTPMDILYEENVNQYNQRNFNSKTIYEWNIDGKSEYQIYALVHQMMMYSTVCKQNDNTDHQVAGFIVAGFTGILRGWWDNYLTTEQQKQIIKDRN